MKRTRAFYASSFCNGKGIEIGALHHPIDLPPGAKVRYVDRMTTPDLKAHYVELEGENLVEVDIVDDGEKLATLPDGQEDFAVACQFIEHCENPVRALVNMLRVVRDRGFVLLTVPDKWQTFDKDRAITTNEHLLDECLHGTQATAREHYRDYLRFVEAATEDKLEDMVDNWIRRQISIHWHVWDPDAFLQFLLFFKERLRLPFQTFATQVNGSELLVVLQKKVA